MAAPSLFPSWPAELFLFPFGGDKLSLFLSLHPQTSYPTLVGLIGMFSKKIYVLNDNLYYLYRKLDPGLPKVVWDALETISSGLGEL